MATHDTPKASHFYSWIGRWLRMTCWHWQPFVANPEVSVRQWSLTRLNECKPTASFHIHSNVSESFSARQWSLTRLNECKPTAPFHIHSNMSESFSVRQWPRSAVLRFHGTELMDSCLDRSELPSVLRTTLAGPYLFLQPSRSYKAEVEDWAYAESNPRI